MTVINGLIADQVLTGLIVSTVLITLADLVGSVAASVRDNTFRLDLVAVFVQSHVVGRVVPIALIAVLGHYEAALMALAVASAGAYALETIGSIKDSLLLPREAKERVAALELAGNLPPTVPPRVTP